MHSSPLTPHSSSPVELKERVETERRGRPFLIYRDGGGNQRIIVLDDVEDQLTVGRRPSNPIGLSWDVNVSRVHAQIERIGDAWTIADDGLSRNGTFVNEARLTGRRRLLDGDVMRFGDTLIAYAYGRSVEAVVATVQPRRRVLRQRLGKATTRFQQQEAAGGLAQMFAGAARRARRLEPPPVATGANAALVDALNQAAKAYAHMRTSAQRFDRAGFERAEAEIRKAESRVQGSLDALRQLGYTIL